MKYAYDLSIPKVLREIYKKIEISLIKSRYCSTMQNVLNRKNKALPR